MNILVTVLINEKHDFFNRIIADKHQTSILSLLGDNKNLFYFTFIMSPL